MRRFDKIKNIRLVNCLNEQNYLKNKGTISEMFSGPTIDIDGITDSLVTTTLQGGDDNTVYSRAKDSLSDADSQIKAKFYKMLSDKMKANNLIRQSQEYSSIAQQYQ